jgi:hypothetical protein
MIFLAFHNQKNASFSPESHPFYSDLPKETSFEIGRPVLTKKRPTNSVRNGLSQGFTLNSLATLMNIWLKELL